MFSSSKDDFSALFLLTKEEERILPQLKDLLFEAGLVDAFLAYLKDTDHIIQIWGKFLDSPFKVDSLKNKLVHFFSLLFDDPFSVEFYNLVQKVGTIHAEIGVRPCYIVWVTNFLYSFFMDLPILRGIDDPCLWSKTYMKLLHYNVTMLLNRYFELNNQDFEKILAELASLNRIHVLLREINFLIYEERSSAERLFTRACDILHKMGNFSLVWVGIEEDEDKDLKIIAAKGRTDYLENFSISRHEKDGIWNEYIKELISGHPLLIRDLWEESRKFPILKRAYDYGFKSLIVLPLYLEAKLKGILCLYHDQPCSLFDKASLLMEVAKDLSLAWTHIVKSVKLKRILFTDELTGLGNEKYFLKALERELDVAQKRNNILAVFRIDLDNFSLINHSFGYLIGDEILKEIAKRLISLEGLLGTIARTGPDDFAISFLLEKEEQIHEILLAVRKKIEEPITFQEKLIKVTPSIGIAIFPKDAQDPKSLFEAATVALKKAQKESPGGLALYTEKETLEIFHRFKLLDELERALENEEFVLFYQPRIDLVHRKISGFEALIRWQHPERGLILPGEFISILEDSGLIIKVGRWIMRETALFLKRLNALYPNIGVSFNLSVKQFEDQGLIQALAEIVKEIEINPTNFQIEITERVLFEAKATAACLLQDIKALGLKIGIDDFGTGFSSLVYLKRIPAESLKIDYSFVRGLPDNREDVEIVKAIVGMAKNLSKQTVAEGVETREQLAFLTGLGVDEVQGFYFARPMPEEEVFSFLENFAPEEYFWHPKRRTQ